MSYGYRQARTDVGYGHRYLGFKGCISSITSILRTTCAEGYFVHQSGLNAAHQFYEAGYMEAASTDDFFKATGRNVGLNLSPRQGLPLPESGAIASTRTSMSKAGPMSKRQVAVWAVSHARVTSLRYEGLIAQVGMSPGISRL